MAETARHVNTMEAHHAPNWSRKHHVDGAHDKPSATSGTHRASTAPTRLELMSWSGTSRSPTTVRAENAAARASYASRCNLRAGWSRGAEFELGNATGHQFTSGRQFTV